MFLTKKGNINEKRKIYMLDEVFKSSGVPTYTFVKRNDVEDKLNRGLASRNRALLFLGYSKSGKTVYRKKYFEGKDYKLVIFRCNKDSKVQDMYNQIVNDLQFPPKDGVNSYEGLKENYNFGGSVGNEDIAKFSSEKTIETDNSTALNRRYVPINIDVNYICNNMKNKEKAIIILEDYHLVSTEFNKRFSEDLKHFIDEEIIFIIIGIPSTPDRTFKNNPDLGGRSDRIEFDYLSYEEVEEIITKGESYLHVKFPREVKEKVHTCSMHNAFLVQAICYEILHMLGIRETQIEEFSQFPKDIVENACKNLSNTTLKLDYSPILDVILNGGRTQQDGKAYNQYAELIRGLKKSTIEKIEKGLTYKDIGKIAWDSLDPDYILKYIENKTYKNETTFKTSLNNQISVAMDKIGDNFVKSNVRPILIVNDKKLYLMDIVFKFYLDWKD